MGKLIAVIDPRVVITVVIFALGLLVPERVDADEKQFPGKALFQRMVGEWTGKGKLTSPVSGDVIVITETWVGKFSDDGKSFEIKGDRLWNDETQTFTWNYSFNATTESLDVIYTASSIDKEVSMEVSVNEAEGVISLLAPMGTEGAEIQIENKFVKGELVSAVVLKGNDGQTVLKGTLKHSRENKANEEGKKDE